MVVSELSRGGGDGGEGMGPQEGGGLQELKGSGGVAGGTR